MQHLYVGGLIEVVFQGFGLGFFGDAAVHGVDAVGDDSLLPSIWGVRGKCGGSEGGVRRTIVLVGIIVC